VQRCADRKLRHDLRLVVEPLGQSATDRALVEVSLGEIDEEIAVPPLGFRQVRVEGRQLRVAADDFTGVVAEIRRFAQAPLNAARDAAAFASRWPPGGPWQPAPSQQRGREGEDFKERADSSKPIITLELAGTSMPKRIRVAFCDKFASVNPP